MWLYVVTVCDPCFPSKIGKTEKEEEKKKKRERKEFCLTEKKDLCVRAQFNHFFKAWVLTEIENGEPTICWFLKRVVFSLSLFYTEKNFDMWYVMQTCHIIKKKQSFKIDKFSVLSAKKKRWLLQMIFRFVSLFFVLS
jgi:hypothetical protein